MMARNYKSRSTKPAQRPTRCSMKPTKTLNGWVTKPNKPMMLSCQAHTSTMPLSMYLKGGEVSDFRQKKRQRCNQLQVSNTTGSRHGAKANGMNLAKLKLANVSLATITTRSQKQKDASLSVLRCPRSAQPGQSSNAKRIG